ncbi:MAG: HDOD domain-containing protein [Mariprofundaceae bacterium]
MMMQWLRKRVANSAADAKTADTTPREDHPQRVFDLDLSGGEGIAAINREPPAASDTFIEQLQLKINSMPKPSWVWHTLQTAFAEHASMGEIGKIIAQDTALAAEMIHIANAPAFGLLTPIQDVERAVSHLGGNLVRSTATRHCLSGSLHHAAGFYDQQMLWRHAMAVSALAEQVARHVPHCNAREAATLGLLHDMGRMLLNHILRASTMEPTHILLEPKGYLHWEAMIAGCTHIEAGTLLAVHWDFPDKLVQGIRFHHHPGHSEAAAVPEAVRNEVFAVYLADLIAIHMKFPGGNPCKSLPHASYADFLPRTTLQDICSSEVVSKALWQVYATDF